MTEGEPKSLDNAYRSFAADTQHLTSYVTSRIECSILSDKLLFFVDTEFWRNKLQSYWQALLSWRRGSVVTTSVFGWRTLPDLRLIYGWLVTTSWVKCPLWVNQLVQLRLPSLRGRQITRITGVETINGRPGLRIAVRRRPKSVGAGLAYCL